MMPLVDVRNVPLHALSRDLAALDARLRDTPDDAALRAQRADLYAQHDAALDAHLGVTRRDAAAPPSVPGPTSWRQRLDAACAAYDRDPSTALWEARQAVLDEGVAEHGMWVIGQVGSARLRLDGARLDGAILDGARLDGAILDGAILVRARLDGASLDGASLDGAILDGASLDGASLVGAILDGASLDGASLVGASLVGARLDGASLDGASLDGASLDGAILDGAILDGASLDGASLDGASLDGASLVGARLDGASLVRASLDRIRDDVYRVLDLAPAEVPYLLRALRAGQINGSAYVGPCACLIGTIAKARGCHYMSLGDLRPDASSLAETWFVAIRQGDTPASSEVARVTEAWIVAWLGRGDIS